MNVSDALKYGKNRLKKAGIDSYSIDCELLLSKTIGFKKIELFTKGEYLLNGNEKNIFELFLKRREAFEPIAYILEKQEFMGLNFFVDKSTLIPRCDTEILVEKVIETANKKYFKYFLDIGTGSGAIAVSISKYIDNALFDAVDISDKALKKAFENAQINAVSDRINFIKSNIYENIKNKVYDVIVSNPPYIKTDAINTLEKNVKDFEPLSALDGGYDGLYFYKKITKGALKRLKKGGMLFFEIGFDQSFEVSEIMKKNGFVDILILKDLAGLDRVVYAVKP